jgi:UDP-glucose 4-epimerase|tara:strand:+ start:1122 stop:1973 length:852 start_codon:yes stop_codon:yes gene_type:complete
LKVLVTGGAGFVGSHLCERLVNEGHDVTSIDNYFTGSEDNHVQGVLYRDLDTRDVCELPTNFDIVYHLGEYSRVEQSFDDFEKVWEYNKIGTKCILDFVKKCDAKLVYAGSSTKFTNEHIGYIKSPYTWSKETNTEFVKLFCEWNSIDYAITYFYNVYGPREIESGPYATLIAMFINKVKNGEPLTIVQPGTQKRNFTHIDDIIDGLILVGKEGYGDEYGIGCDDSYTIMDVAAMFGINTKIEMLPARKGNRMSAKVITDRTRALGWSSRKNLKDYISARTAS